MRVLRDTGVVTMGRVSNEAAAISLSTMHEQAPDLVNLYKSAGAGVRAHGL